MAAGSTIHVHIYRYINGLEYDEATIAAPSSMKSLRPTKKLLFRSPARLHTLCMPYVHPDFEHILIHIYIYLSHDSARQPCHFFEEMQRTRFKKEVLHYRISGHSAPAIFLRHSAVYIYVYKFKPSTWWRSSGWQAHWTSRTQLTMNKYISR